MPSHSRPIGTVRDAFYQLARDSGCTVIFGNPGSTELPMFRHFPKGIEYVLGLQEACVVSMADGYAQATEKPAFVNLHSAAGVGNAMGAIYTAFKNQTPLVIVAGQQHRALQPFDPYLFSRQVTDLPRPYIKFCVEPARAEDVPQAIARAYQVSMQHPRGPVMVSVPADDWDKPGGALEPRRAFNAIRPDPLGIQALQREIGASKQMAIVVGAGLDRDGAWVEGVRLAEACRAAVFAAPLSARCSFPENHPLFQGFLPGAGKEIHDHLTGYDLVLVIGAPAFTYHVPRGSEGAHVPAGTRLVVLTDDPEAAAAVPQGVSVLGSIRLALAELLQGLPTHDRPTPPARPSSPAVDPSTPLTAAYVLQAISEFRNQSDVIVEEAPSARPWMQQYLPITQPGGFFTMASGGLGFGMPAAVGIALADRSRKVIGVMGDGSSMYSIQSLWTAARYNLNITFVVLNNSGYAAMKRHARLLNFDAREKIVGIDVPGIRFDLLADAQGCPGERVTDAGNLRASLSSASLRAGPCLIEPPRVLRRLFSLRGLSHEQEVEPVFTRGPRTRCSHGA